MRYDSILQANITDLYVCAGYRSQGFPHTVRATHVLCHLLYYFSALPSSDPATYLITFKNLCL